MYESISKNNELENEMTLDMSYFWYSDVGLKYSPLHPHKQTLLAFLLVLIPNGPSTTCLHHQNLISGFIC